MCLRTVLRTLLLGACGTMAAPAQAPAHLLLAPDDFTRINKLAETEPWAGAARTALLKEADAFPASYEKKYGLSTVELPPEGGSWYHLYVCPATGTRLVFHPPDQNICPDTGKNLKGFPYDQHAYSMRADDLGRAAYTLGLAYRLTQRQSYATAAADILTKYATIYSKYQNHDNDGKVGDGPKGARVYSQPLDEAIWLMQLAWTYDLIRDSTALTPDTRKQIEEKLLRPSAATVSRVPGSTYNIQSWVNGAVAAVGFTLDDQTLVKLAIDGENGFRAQMKNRVVDGFWIEGAWHYQFYALEPLERTAMMATRAGIPLWKQEPHLADLLASPIGLMFPDGTLPAFNDSSEDDVYDHKALYEAAYTATHNPLFAAIAVHDGRKPGKHADTSELPGMLEALLFGEPTLPTAGIPALESRVFPEAGYATLRSPQGGMMEVMKFGPHGGVHGHFDKLNEVLYADGRMMTVDPGTQLYGAPTHKTWDGRTVAHNTMVVDEQDQKAATGKLLFWSATPEATIASADAGDVYAQADLKRTVLMTNDYILEISSATSKDGRDHDFDWCYHNYGKEAVQAQLTPYAGFPQANGYQNLSPAFSGIVSSDIRSSFDTGGQTGINVWMLGATQTQAFAGSGPGPDLKSRVPYLMTRRKGKSAEFVTLLQPKSSKVVISFFTSTATQVTIKSSGWVDTFTRGDSPSYHRELLH